MAKPQKYTPPAKGTTVQDTPVDEVKDETQATGQTDSAEVKEVIETVIPVAEVIHPVEPVIPAVEVVAEVAIIEPVVEVQVVEEKLTNDFATAISAAIDQFCQDTMPGKPLVPDVGARFEQGLYNQLLSLLLNCPIEEFPLAWRTVIGKFAFTENKALGDRYIFRFAPYWTLSNDHCMAYHSLVNLIKVSADTNKVQKQIDMDRALATLDSEVRNKIFSYYKL